MLCAAAALSACGGNSTPDPSEQASGGDAASQMPNNGGDSGTREDGGPPAFAPMMGMSTGARAALLALSPEQLPAAPPDVSNKYADDAAAAALGKQFFFDPGFSGKLLDEDNIGDERSLGTVGETGKVSCAGCHIPKDGFLDTRSVRQTVSLAAAWGKRKTPSLLDVSQVPLLMWDGRFDTMYNQTFGALEEGVEVNSSRLYAAQQIYERYRAPYEAIFGAITVPLDDRSRFPQLDGNTTGCRDLTHDRYGIAAGIDCHGIPGDKAEYDGLSAADQDAVTRIWTNAGKAIAAYERLLTCGPGRFDAWMRGDAAALTPSEQRGARLFVGERADGSKLAQACSSCHSGPFLTDNQFHNVGMRPTGVGPAASFLTIDDVGYSEGLPKALASPLNVKGKYSDGDDGRLPDAVPANAEGAFRTPSLRCVALRPTFMHNGQFRNMRAVIGFFDRGGDPEGFHGTNELVKLNLTEEERVDLEAFMGTLTGPGPDAALIAEPTLPPP